MSPVFEQGQKSDHDRQIEWLELQPGWKRMAAEITADIAEDELDRPEAESRPDYLRRRADEIEAEEADASPGVGTALPKGVGTSGGSGQVDVAGLYSELDGLLKHPTRHAKRIAEVTAALRAAGETNL